MDDSAVQTDSSLDTILATVRKYWGFDQLRPLQAEAIKAGLEHRDSMVVMPTGGGKSLCYQVPPAIAGRTDIVVSPLISLMKDQVDGLLACGYPAAAIYSGQPPAQRLAAYDGLVAGTFRIVFVAPERLVSPEFLQTLDQLNIRAFAIDEAHCISHWGHDFRPKYRKLAMLKQRFSQASVAAYTATATQRVQQDVIEQLGLTDPVVLVGCFDRPNLVYRVVPRLDVYEQVYQAIQRHKGNAAIVYCISRKDTEKMAESLQSQGVRAEAYHAGLGPDRRRRIQDAFAAEKIDVVVATVAFGMGIDRSDVRLVAHAASPKSIEHYQQETGRAGRDGLEAECVLFHSPIDVRKWEWLIRKTVEEANAPPETADASLELLKHIRQYASAMRCRHKALSEYFGQQYQATNCGACDVCLDEMEGVTDATVLAQKILSCVFRVGGRFGVGHVVDVLLGANKESIVSRGHDRVSTFGLLKAMDRKSLVNMTHQLVDQGLLGRTVGDYPTLYLNEASWAVLHGEKTVHLIKPRTKAPKKTRYDEQSWEGVDRGLFENLRQLRRKLALDRNVPAYVIFTDATLRDLARLRPASLDTLRLARGIGEQKLADFGSIILDLIKTYCAETNLSRDVGMHDRIAPTPRRSRLTPQLIKMFARDCSIEQVMATLNRAHGTTVGYLAEFIRVTQPDNIDTWVDPNTYRLVEEAVAQVGSQFLRPIFEHLDGKVPYDTIRLVVAHQEVKRQG